MGTAASTSQQRVKKKTIGTPPSVIDLTNMSKGNVYGKKLQPYSNRF